MRSTDSLCLRCGGTVRGMPWNEPCQGEKEGAEYPPCAEKDGGERIIKKRTERGQTAPKATLFLLLRTNTFKSEIIEKISKVCKSSILENI